MYLNNLIDILMDVYHKEGDIKVRIHVQGELKDAKGVSIHRENEDDEDCESEVVFHS